MTDNRYTRCVALFILGFFAVTAHTRESTLVPSLLKMEQSLQARIGVAVYDTQSGQRWQYRGNERFPISSTFKPLACGALLQKVDQGIENLDRIIPFNEQDLVTYSPVTESRVDSGGMSLFELCDATITISDNTAGNLVLRSVGGPEALTRFLRSVGDEVTRLDRWETDLNEAVPGDVRDTTTPVAMVELLDKLVLGEILENESRSILENWMVGNAVGDDLFRAGIPADWRIADKTGAGGYGSRSISAVMWPPSRGPVVAAVYITDTTATFDARNAAIATIGAAIAAEVLE